MEKYWSISLGEVRVKQRDTGGRFAPGNSLGKKSTKPLAHSFKKGEKPWNHKENGNETLRRKSGNFYWFIKSEGKWVIKHRWLFEQAYGVVEPKYVIAFKNGDTTDCRIENLEKITRSESLKRHRDPTKIEKGKRKRMLLIKYGIIQPDKKKR